MRRISLDLAEPNMIIARTIYKDGKVLLVKGTRLTLAYIDRLKRMGFRSVYVEDQMARVSVDEAISEKTRIEAVRAVKESYKALTRNAGINIDEIRASVDYIIDEVLASHDVLLHISEICSYDEYLLYHAAGVCILALATGVELGYHDLMLKELGVGAILHDIGMVNIDPAIINKPSNLTDEEARLIKQHPIVGFDILRKNHGISLLSAHVAFQHHEKWAGGGYPRGLKGEEIHEYARIVSVADVFHALISDRPYRSAYTNSQALTILSRMRDIYFEGRILDAFLPGFLCIPLAPGYA